MSQKIARIRWSHGQWFGYGMCGLFFAFGNTPAEVWEKLLIQYWAWTSRHTL